MRIAFLGSPACAIEPLGTIIESGEHMVVGVVSQPAKPSGRKRVLTDPPVAQFAKDRRLNVLQPVSASEQEFLRRFAALKPDVAVTAAYGQILSKDFLSIPKRATINIHPSLLPEFRGATPVPAALLAGRETTGVTILFTVRKLDAGNIIKQRTEAISSDETALELTNRLFRIGGTLLIEALKKLESSSFEGFPQEDQLATYCKKIDKEDGWVDWSESARSIVNRFRAYQPWPGLFTYLGHKRIVLSSVSLSPINLDATLQPIGSIVYMDGKVHVKAGDGFVVIDAVKPAGGAQIAAHAFWNGLKQKDTAAFARDKCTR